MSKLLDEPTFSLELPELFEIHREEDGLQCVCREPAAVLSLSPEVVEDSDSLPNLSRMLASFLTRMGHPVATDELLRVTSVPQAIGFSWQYMEDGKYLRFWLFGNQFSFLLVTFVCLEQNRGHFQETLSTCLKTLRLRISEEKLMTEGPGYPFSEKNPDL